MKSTGHGHEDQNVSPAIPLGEILDRDTTNEFILSLLLMKVNLPSEIHPFLPTKFLLGFHLTADM
jgi:hypothetical protein